MELVQEIQDLGGWGAILMYQGNKKEISGGKKDTTNNEKNSNLSVREIVNATNDKKTDFMYSIILQDDDKVSEFIPNYIEEGLNWLIQ